VLACARWAGGSARASLRAREVSEAPT
jgi:hypothetical protein